MFGLFPKKCPECKSKNLAWNSDGLICNKCGLVIRQKFE